MNRGEPDPLEEEGREETRDSAIEDVAGSPTWPITAPGTAPDVVPPVGLNWGTVAAGWNIDRRILQHDGAIVLTGEYFPEAGFFVDPNTLRACHVDIGDMALRPGYFIGDLTASQFNMAVPVEAAVLPLGKPVVARASGPVVGLFADQMSANRAKHRILNGSMGSGIRQQAGPLGAELVVGAPEIAGRVATVIASQGGAVISVGGSPVTGFGGPLVTNASLTGGRGPTGSMGDARRAGTGVTASSEGPEPANTATEIVAGREVQSG